MNLDTPIRILELLGLSGLISIAVTMIVNARRDRRNTHQRNYAHYSKRYADLMAEILASSGGTSGVPVVNMAQNSLRLG